MDGVEYVSPYAPFGPGWFVLRCLRGSLDLKFVQFRHHPLKVSGLGCPPGHGLQHFNETPCLYHDRSQTYTEETMMVSFAQRVVDDDGDDVSEAWVRQSNEHLQETLAKKAAKESARRVAKRTRQSRVQKRAHGDRRAAGFSGTVAIKEEPQDGIV